MSEKTYINGLFIKKKQFQNGGDCINISINVAKFVQELQSHTNDKGYCNIVLNNRKQADDKGNNMYAVLDTFQPTQKKEYVAASIPQKQNEKRFDDIANDNGDLPFL